MSCHIDLPLPMTHQREIFESSKRFKMATCGRRFGKTYGVGLPAVIGGHGPQTDTGRMYRGAVEGARIAWLTSTNKNANRVIWPTLKRATKDLWVPRRGLKSEIDKTISFPNDKGLPGSITVWSAESPDAIRGEGLNAVVFDEAAFATRGDYIWFDVLRPALMDSRGWAIFITTPHGRNWYYKLKEFAKDRDNWGTWQLPSHENPLLGVEELSEIEAEARAFGRSVAGELYAEFVKLEGCYWDHTLFDGLFRWSEVYQQSRLHNGWPNDLLYSVMAVDNSFGGDYQAISIVGTNGDGHLYCEIGLGKDTEDELADKVLRMALRLPKLPVFVIVEEPRNKKSGTGALQRAIDRAARKRGTLLTTQNVQPQEHEFEKAPPGGGLKDIRIIGMNDFVQEGSFRFVDTPETRRGVDQFVDFRPGLGSTKDRKDDAPDATARAIVGLNSVASELVA